MILSAHQVLFAGYLGFFSKIKQSDIFVLLDLYQFSKGDKNKFENRNRIRCPPPKNEQWLVVPCQNTSNFKAMIDVKIDNSQPWKKKIIKSIEWNYIHAPFFQSYWYKLKPIFRVNRTHLVELNHELIIAIMDILDINVDLRIQSQDVPLLLGDSTDKLIWLCEFFDADTFLFGSHGKRYVKKVKFQWNDIKMIFQEYHHPIYKQQFEPFMPNLSVLDSLFCCGSDKVKEMI